MMKTLPYALHVRFDDLIEGDLVTGLVTVTAREACTCRKMRIVPGRRWGSDDDLWLDEQQQFLVDRVEWRSGETYSYPFSFRLTEGSTLDWGIVTVVIRVGEMQPDPARTWLCVPTVQVVPDKLAGIFPERQLENRAAEPDVPGATETASPDRFSLQFDRRDRYYHFGDAISGAMTFLPGRNLAHTTVELHYQWRTHGQTEPRRGAVHTVTVSEERSWRKGQAYRLPFNFAIARGPRSYHGYGQKLDWYVWVALVSGGETDDNIRQFAEKELFLVPRWAAGLLVEEVQATSDHLKPGLFALLIPLLSAAAIIINWSRLWPWAARQDEFVGVILLAVTILLVGLLWYSIENLVKRGLAEIWLGALDVTLGGWGEVMATVSMRPRRTVSLKELRLSITVYEETTVRQGTTTTTRRKKLYHARKRLELGETVEAGMDWGKSLALALRPHLPVTDQRPPIGDESVSIKWEANLEIFQRGAFAWRNTYPLTITDSRLRSQW